MRIPLLDLKAQFETIRDDVLPVLQDIIESQRFIMGEAVGQLEQAVADYVGVSDAIACASGTDALLLSLKTLEFEPGDEVVTTPFTFFATAGTIHNTGGTPVFIDIDPDTFNLNVDLLPQVISPRTRAIIPVHLFGQMASMEAVARVAEQHELTVIEDAAQAIGARRKIAGGWRMAGTLGQAGAFSFFPSKNLGCWGDGGLITTNDSGLAQRLRRLRTHGGAKQYHHDEVGTNSRLDTIQAAVLLAKLPRLDGWNAARRERAALYVGGLTGIDGVTLPHVDEVNEHVYHQFTIRAQRRDELKRYLAERGIGVAVYYPRALHEQPCFRDLGYMHGQFPEAERACREVLSLPCYPELTHEQQMVVIETIREFYA